MALSTTRQKIETYFQQIGFQPVTLDETKKKMPEEIFKHYPEPVRDIKALMGIRPPSLKSVRQWNNIFSRYYDSSLMSTYEIEIAVLEYLHDVVGKGTIVDAGCGTGLNLVFLAQALPQTQMIGYDISQKMIALAKDKVKKIGGCSNLLLLTSPHTNIYKHIKPASADLVYCKCFDICCQPLVPFFEDSPLGYQSAYWKFFSEDAVVGQMRQSIVAFKKILKPGGFFISIGRECNCNPVNVLEEVISQEKFKVKDDFYQPFGSAPGDDEDHPISARAFVV